MKKIICLVLGILLSCACFAGCNVEEPDEKPATSPPTYVEPTPNSGIVSATINKVESKALTLVYNNTSIQKKIIKGSYIDAYMSSRIIENKAIIGWSTTQNGSLYTSKIDGDVTLYAVLGDYVKYNHTKTQENAYTITVKANSNEKAFFIDFNDIKAIDVQTQADLDAQVENAKQQKEEEALSIALANKMLDDPTATTLTPQEIQAVKDKLYSQDPNYGVDVSFTPELSKKFTLSVESSIEFIYIKGVSDSEIDLQLNSFIRQKPLYVTLDNTNISSSASKAVFDFTNVVGAMSVVETVGSSKISCKNYSAGVLANDGNVSITGDGVSALTIIGGDNNGDYAGTAINAKKLLINNLTLSAKGGKNVSGQGGVSILSNKELSLVQCAVSANGGDGKTGGYCFSYAKDAVMNLVPNSFVFTGFGGQGETDDKDGKDFKFSYLGYSD